ncbi:MAG TPA: cyclic peptide export ABC transporter [Thermoanaerobaculia bacterium]|nr:cyclic peptide export ABC transporter [Thermoanaerobaculia bacterium]
MVEILKLVAFLLRISRRIHFSRFTVAAAIVTALLSGVGYTALVAVIGAALSRPPSRNLLWTFLGLCVVVPACRLGSQALFNWIGAKSVFELRLSLCRQVLGAPLRRLEDLGPHRLLVTLTDDVTNLTNALVLIPVLAMDVAIIGACLAYMGWLSPRLLLFVLGFMILGVLSYGLPLRQARKRFVRMREEMDALFRQFQGLLFGTKELKLHRLRRQAFVERSLVPTGEEIRRLTFVGNTIFTAAATWGNLLFFFAFGLILFVFGRDRGGALPILAGYTLALLYMMTPLEVLFQSLPALGRAAVAVSKIDRLGLDLAGASEPEPELDAAAGAGWQRLELAGVTHTYRGESDHQGFHLGPIDLSFRPGELVFLIGGNGSGKTTLAKLLTGLYTPERGEIRLDGRPIDDENRDAYRQLFSAVFADFYLFESLIGIERSDLDGAARDYLAQLQLTEKVKVEGGVLSTLDLSQGQRKRLALLTAYLEDRPIYFFDEWAADQDPQYKAVFYFELLPELKARGKTIFVISHDDQYYPLGDRLIKLNYGQIESDRPSFQAQSADVEAG